MYGKARTSAVVAALALASCAGPPNLHRIDEKVWRSGQPTRHDIRRLKNEGIREILSLRRWHPDDELSSAFELHRVRMQAHAIDDGEMARALAILARSEGPILIHCWHGSDRTGALVALYRMVVRNWPREKAIAELMNPAFGHHADIFPNVRRYLETVDIPAMRRRMQESAPRRSCRMPGNRGIFPPAP